MRIPVWLVILLLPVAASWGQTRSGVQYTVVEVPLLPGATYNSAKAINSAGEVVGHSGNLDWRHATFFRQGRLFDLGTFGGNDSEAFGINNVGQIVGQSRDADGVDRPFVFSGETMVDIGLYNTLRRGAVVSVKQRHLFGSAAAINDQGTIVGRAAFPKSTIQAFIHPGPGSLRPEDNIDGDLRFSSRAIAINQAGQVTGFGFFPTDPFARRIFCHAFLHAGFGRLEAHDDLGTLGGERSLGLAINADGDVVGMSALAAPDKHIHAFLYTHGKMTDLGTLAELPYSQALGINDQGVIVGMVGQTDSFDATSRAFVVLDGAAPIDLNKLIPSNSGWVLSAAIAVNASGWIVGDGIFKGVHRAFLLKPIGVAEPGGAR